nr:Uncharacterised protein [Klebsiella pneumoniae]
MSSNLCHQFIRQLRKPLDSQLLFFIVTLTSRYKLDKTMRWSFNDSKK